VAKTTGISAGRIRRIRRSQNLARLNEPSLISFKMSEEIRNPEMTKKMSTPTKPPRHPRPA
jgi:hypothetical protein